MAGSFCLGLAGFLTQHDDFKAAKKSQLGAPFPFLKHFPPTHTSGKLRLEDDHAYKKIYDLKVPLNFIQIFAFLATTHPDVRAKTVIIQMSTNRDHPDDAFFTYVHVRTPSRF